MGQCRLGAAHRHWHGDRRRGSRWPGTRVTAPGRVPVRVTVAGHRAGGVRQHCGPGFCPWATSQAARPVLHQWHPASVDRLARHGCCPAKRRVERQQQRRRAPGVRCDAVCGSRCVSCWHARAARLVMPVGQGGLTHWQRNSTAARSGGPPMTHELSPYSSSGRPAHARQSASRGPPTRLPLLRVTLSMLGSTVAQSIKSLIDYPGTQALGRAQVHF